MKKQQFLDNEGLNVLVNEIVEATIQSLSISAGTNNGTIKLTIDGTVHDNISVKGLGSAAYVSKDTFAASSPTFTQAATLSNIISGESFTIMLGKIAKSMADFITHKADAITHLTAAERTNWNDANSKKHTHSNKAVIDTLTQAMIEKLNSVASGAEVNVQADWSATDITSDAYIKNKPTALPASDVSSWAKSAKKPSYAWNEITDKPSSFTPITHTHTKSQITDFPSGIKNPNALTLSLNGTSQGGYDGSAAKTINVTAASIGAAATSHGTHVTYSSTPPKIAGNAAVGTASTVSRSDHVHPKQTICDTILENITITAASFSASLVATYSNSSILDTQVPDVFFAKDSIAVASKAGITVETAAGQLKLTAKKAPTADLVIETLFLRNTI